MIARRRGYRRSHPDPGLAGRGRHRVGDSSSWKRRSPTSSGWKAVTVTRPCGRRPDALPSPASEPLAMTSTPRPRSDDGRPDEHGVQRPAGDADELESPQRTRSGDRRRSAVPRGRSRRSSTGPTGRRAPSPRAGSSPQRSEDRHARRVRAAISGRKPAASMSNCNVVDSPPGSTRASTPSRSPQADLHDADAERSQHGGVLGDVALEGEDPDHRRRAVRTARPRRAVIAAAISPAAFGEPRLERRDLRALHRRAEARDTLARISGSRKCAVASTIARARTGGPRS